MENKPPTSETLRNKQPFSDSNSDAPQADGTQDLDTISNVEDAVKENIENLVNGLEG